jgi:phenylacetate-CoA ligase
MDGRLGLVDQFFHRVVWPLWARRDHPRLPGFLREVERRQFDPPGVIAVRQQTMLRRILQHAIEQVPYYRQLGVSPRLSEFPILTKSTVRAQSEWLRADNYRHRPVIAKKTSGSTGVPLKVLIDEDGLAWKRACTIRADEWSGWRRGCRVAKAWGNPEYRQFGLKGWLRNRLFERAIHLDTLKMTDADIADFAWRLQRHRPRLIFGHAHSVYLLADYLRQHRVKPPRPNGIITTAMILHDFERQRIEEVFGCPVTNRYGCEEVSLIACECPAHQGLHVNVDSVFVEILDGDQPARPGQPGQVVVTDLTNFAMPLVRYRVGDVASWSAQPCPCGRSFPVLERIEGREADYVVTASGHRISGISLTENFATLVPGIAQLQIVQEEVERFRFRIVPAPEFAERGENRLAELVRERFGPATRYTCEFVDVIPAEPSGKYRFCISHVAREQAA